MSPGRPKKYRNVAIDPKTVYFSPRGRPGRPEEVEMSVDEYEAVRLADLLTQPQKNASLDMQISQQTFSRILRRARGKIADALVNGKILRIQGGKYRVSSEVDLSGNSSRKSARKIRPK